MRCVMVRRGCADVAAGATIGRMPKPKTAGRPVKTTKPPRPNITGLRIPPDIIARLDALAESLTARPEQVGAVSRNAAVLLLLRQGLDAHEAAARISAP